MKYDLRFEPWISVEYLDGSKNKVGLQQLFEQAHEIGSFHHDNPLAEAALMRILIALSHRILDGPKDRKEWKETFEAGRYDADAVEAYFDRWKDRFDLFHEKYPFMQVAELKMIDNKTKVPLNYDDLPSLDLLIHHVANGNNATLFDHNRDEEPHLYEPSEAIYWLLVAIFYGLGGTHKKSTNLCGYQGNCKNGIAVNGMLAFVYGETLFETLMINTLSDNFTIPSTKEDMPFWEYPNGICEESMPKGYLDYLTFTGRLIRLVPTKDIKIEKVHFACGRSLQESIKDPFAPTKIEKNQEKVLAASLERSLWRDSDTLFRYTNDGFTIASLQQLSNIGRRKIANKPYVLSVYGLVNNKANPQGYLKEMLPIPLSILNNPYSREKIRNAVSNAENIGKSLNDAIKSFYEEVGILPKKPKSKKERDRKKQFLETKLRENYWSTLELPFKSFLNEIDSERALQKWEKQVQNSAVDAFDKVTKPLLGQKARLLEAYVKAQQKLYQSKGGKS